MSHSTKDSQSAGAPVCLAEHKAHSRAFQPMFDEGMELVDETATYLDGEGRKASRMLPKSASTLYAAESMRLTTRLMQMASWLLLQRALNEGDMTRAQVEAEKKKVRLNGEYDTSTDEQYAHLPDHFRDLVMRARLLERRIALLDRELYGFSDQHEERAVGNPVGEQINLLKTAFHR
ncbi:DUF1465 family protein [Fulvimarina sp. 2208YS6-2-32]|uniref:DUF1465 family protein n=1 Tax=Fulvimarina uroteuthidis TaxID=3098149 RepID=A0ABU5HZD5_9HYPH|nr:DUF1465 family protein [Fulvimarina sp. 2208YS6-2-32]MDY8108326.1 DUF1465 family protein [Fulvimarina sp. 2208YS6-2-32]